MSYWKIRITVAVLFGFLFSTYLMLEELQYALWGRTTQAQLMDVRGTSDIGASGHSTPALAFEYAFNDSELGNRVEKDMVPTGWQRPAGDKVDVQYIPGEKDASRLAGHRNMSAVWFFMACLGVLTVFVIKLAREANEPVRKPRPAAQRG